MKKQCEEKQQAGQAIPLVKSSRQLIEVAAAIQSQLRAQQQLGIETYPLLDGLLPSAPKKKEVHKPKQVRAPSTPKPNISSSKKDLPDLPQKDSLLSLYGDIASCNKCSFSGNEKITAPEVGKNKVRLMVIGDYRLQSKHSSLFGREEDEMLKRMIVALGLAFDEVYVTNFLKCSCRNDVLPTLESVESCASFIFREVALVKPSVVCAMGELAGQGLVGRKDTVSRMRGSFRKYCYYDRQPIQVMVTYHPRFLLANPEMKPATWKDLQKIQRSYLNASSESR